MRQTIKLFLLTTILFSCEKPNDKKSSRTKTLDFEKFTIHTPLNWNKIRRQGIDSFVGAIVIDSLDTLWFDYGPYSSSLDEREPDFIMRWQLKDLGPTFDTTNYVIVDKPSDIDVDKYKTYNIKWDTIDSRTAKILFQIIPGKGTTGIYFDSVNAGTSIGRTKFNLYGKNLHPKNEKAFLQVIKTIRFK